jgi:hypothetical protein
MRGLWAPILAGSPAGPGTSLRQGECSLSLPEESKQRLDTKGPGPLAVGLATDAAGRAEQLDLRLSQGVNIQLLGPAAGG